MKTSVKMLMVCFITAVVAACGAEEKDITERMAEEHEGDVPVQNQSVLYEQMQPVDSMEVNYAKTDSGAITGFLAKPQNAEGELPGILVIHEWWGLNDNVRMMTKRLAGLGYVALAVDLYNGKVASSPEFARQYMQQAMANPEGAIDNLKQAYKYLEEEQNAGNIGVIGWCFGGGWALKTALEMPDKIDATVIYYGELVTDLDPLRTLNMPVVGFFGGQDQGIPIKTVNTFKDNLELLDKNAQIYIYEDAGHAFANPSGNRYNKEAAHDAWEKTKAFFEEHLKN